MIFPKPTNPLFIGIALVGIAVVGIIKVAKSVLSNQKDDESVFVKKDRINKIRLGKK
jgi:hypothetical protein